MSPIQGVDLASYQGADIDFAAVRDAGYQFAIVKLTEGDAYTNEDFDPQWQGARTLAGQATYHYLKPTLGRPEAEIDYYVRQLDAHGARIPGVPSALDIEEGQGAYLAYFLRAEREHERLLGFPPLVYSRTLYLAQTGLLNSQVADRCGLWLASWSGVMPQAPAPWTFIACWQSGQGTVPGITTGLVDQDTFLGTVAQFRLYGAPAPPGPRWDNNDIAHVTQLLGRLTADGAEGDPDWAGIAAYAAQFTRPKTLADTLAARGEARLWIS